MKFNDFVTLILLTICVLSSVMAVDENDSLSPKAYKKSQGFVVHEWGATILDKRHPYQLEYYHIAFATGCRRLRLSSRLKN